LPYNLVCPASIQSNISCTNAAYKDLSPMAVSNF
jgi:hypothetical protein